MYEWQGSIPHTFMVVVVAARTSKMLASQRIRAQAPRGGLEACEIGRCYSGACREGEELGHVEGAQSKEAG